VRLAAWGYITPEMSRLYIRSPEKLCQCASGQRYCTVRSVPKVRVVLKLVFTLDLIRVLFRFLHQGVDALRKEVLYEIPTQVLEYMHQHGITPNPRYAQQTL
jgi:hypothetical protein